jgi:predicted Zn-ribbon and HTH transcriptional regulator
VASITIAIMKPTRLTLIGMALLGVMFVVWLVLTLATGDGSKTKPAVVDDKHCPKCGREYPPGVFAEKDCPYCKLEANSEGGGTLKPKTTITLPTNFTIPGLMIGCFCALLGTHVFLALRSRLGKNVDDDLFHTRCVKCGRKVRYRKTQIGRVAQCPLCKKPMIFPKPPKEPRRSLWLKLAPW